MSARYPFASVLLRLHFANLAERISRQRKLIVITPHGTGMDRSQLLPREELERQALDDLLAGKGSQNQYLQEHPELVVQFKRKLAEFHRMCTAK